jgi:hypothetical protein
MDDAPEPHRFLTDEEVAQRLRCTKAKVKRLRTTGKLSYLPGRPPHVDVADLEAYIEETKRRATPPRKRQPGEPLTDADIAAIDLRVQRKWLQFRTRAERRIKLSK